jgi:hypothetical protein
MPDVSPAGVLISDLLDAIYTSWSGAVDYRGTALPAANQWVVTRKIPGLVTEAVVALPPAGTPMTKNPAIIAAGRIANAGVMATPDASAASALQIGINKNSGAYVDWTVALPMTRGQWFGYWDAAATSANIVGTVVRSFISAETIFTQIIQASATQWWMYSGAVVEPYDADTTNSGETDNRLYGQFVQGRSALSTTWLNGAGAMWGHGVNATEVHGGVFTPNAGTIFAGGRKNINGVIGSVAETQTPSGVYVGDIMEFARSTTGNTNNGVRMGTIRGVYCAGYVQSGRYLRNGGTDLYHFIGADTLNPLSAVMLPAVP